MEKRLSRWGIGPRTFGPSLLLAVTAWVATREWPEVFGIPGLAPGIRIAGGILMGFGFLLWLAGVVTVMRAYKRDELMTSGPFALVRHPVYSAWITLIFPGLALWARSWLMLFVPLLGYAMFRMLIHREDEYLDRRFGQSYREYRARVNEMLPVPHWRGR
jgi:protein-S-isoprenylcysteine O-methyltransferase Ste14